MPSLKVIVDGAPLPEDEARALWKRFSAHMEANRGDLIGFAKAEGFASVHPVMGPDGAELHASHTAPQQDYRTAPVRGSGTAPQGSGPGSRAPHPTGGRPRKPRGNRGR